MKPACACAALQSRVSDNAMVDHEPRRFPPPWSVAEPDQKLGRHRPGNNGQALVELRRPLYAIGLFLLGVTETGVSDARLADERRFPLPTGGNPFHSAIRNDNHVDLH